MRYRGPVSVVEQIDAVVAGRAECVHDGSVLTQPIFGVTMPGGSFYRQYRLPYRRNGRHPLDVRLCYDYRTGVGMVELRDGQMWHLAVTLPRLVPLMCQMGRLNGHKAEES